MSSAQVRVEKLKMHEFYELIDFIDLVFSKSSIPHDFMKLLPGIYHETQQCVDGHRVIKEKGKIVSAVGSFPSSIVVNGRTLAHEGIGSVATNPRCRGAGYMRSIMEEVIEYYKNNGVMLSRLSGERKRYERYGYEKTGINHTFHITSKNIRECSEDARAFSLTYTEVKECDVAALTYMKGLMDKEIIHVDRDISMFYRIVKNWYSTSYIVTDKSGGYVGYFVYNKGNNSISELLSESVELFEAILIAWIRDNGNVSVNMPPWKPLHLERLLRICEDVRISSNGNWYILDWENVIGSLLKAKTLYSVLADGQINIGVDGYGVLSLLVKENIAECERTECNPDITCDPYTAARLMCGHVSPVYAMDLPARFVPLLQSWFPLPLYAYHADHV